MADTKPDGQAEEDVSALVDALTTAPLGAAFLVHVDRAGLDAGVAADPVMSSHLAARALMDVSIWRPDHASAIADVLGAGARLRSLAERILSELTAARWFAPLDRGRQLVAEFGRSVLGSLEPPRPDRPPTETERYAQMPDWGVFTSTDVAGTGISSFLVGSSQQAGDLGPLTFPLARRRASVSTDARVFEVAGPQAWRHLCLSYPASGNHGIRPLGHDFPDPERQLVPDFVAAAKDWEGVHLSLGGLLTSDQIRLDGPEGWTWLSGWDAEQTIWLRRAFDNLDALPDLVAEIPTPIELR